MAPQTDYPEVLRAAMKNAAMSRNKLSYAVAAKTGNKRDSEYRALGKYLSGDEAPSQERAALLAVLLSDPAVAIVSSHRRDRLAELGATVEKLERALGAVLDRVEALERGQAGRRRAGGGR